MHFTLYLHTINYICIDKSGILPEWSIITFSINTKTEQAESSVLGTPQLGSD